MAESILYLTELLGLQVYDLKGRKLGVLKDAAIVPLVHPARIDPERKRSNISPFPNWPT